MGLYTLPAMCAQTMPSRCLPAHTAQGLLLERRCKRTSRDTSYMLPCPSHHPCRPPHLCHPLIRHPLIRHPLIRHPLVRHPSFTTPGFMPPTWPSCPCRPPRLCHRLVHAAASSVPPPSFRHPLSFPSVVPLICATPTSMSPSSSLPLSHWPRPCHWPAGLVPATGPLASSLPLACWPCPCHWPTGLVPAAGPLASSLPLPLACCPCPCHWPAALVPATGLLPSSLPLAHCPHPCCWPAALVPAAALVPTAALVPATCLVPATHLVCAAPRLPPPSSMRAVWATCFSVTHVGCSRVLVWGGLCGGCGWAGGGGGGRRRHLMVTPILQRATRDNMDARGQSQGHKSRVGIQCFTGCARGD